MEVIHGGQKSKERKNTKEEKNINCYRVALVLDEELAVAGAGAQAVVGVVAVKGRRPLSISASQDGAE